MSGKLTPPRGIGRMLVARADPESGRIMPEAPRHPFHPYTRWFNSAYFSYKWSMATNRGFRLRL